MATNLYDMNALSTTLQIGASLTDIWTQSQAAASAQSLAKWQSMQAEKYGKMQADIIRNRGKETISAATAQMAAQGVDTTSGTGALLIDDIIKRSEHDAFQAVLSGKTQALQFEAQGKMAKAQMQAGQAKSIFGLAQSGLKGIETSQRIKALTGKGGSLFGILD